MNLLDNAIKYSPEGGDITVTSALFYGSDQEVLATLPRQYLLDFVPDQLYSLTAISDQGLGIQEEYRQLVFDKFFKVKSKYQEGRKGVGLGLAFCRQVIEAHDGFIWVDSPVTQDNTAKARGCRFSVILPRGPAQ